MTTSVAKLAQDNGILRNTLYARMKRHNITAEQAVYKIHATVGSSRADHSDMPVMIEFIRSYKADNRGIPPTQNKIREHLGGRGSLTRIRNLLEHAYLTGVLQRTPDGSPALPGELWLEPETVQKIIFIAQSALKNEDPLVRAAAKDLIVEEEQAHMTMGKWLDNDMHESLAGLELNPDLQPVIA